MTADLLARLEALLFVRAEPVLPSQLAVWLQIDEDAVERFVTALQLRLDERGSGLMIDRAAGGVRLVTRPGLYEWLAERLSTAAPEPLSHASWEVLAIVAYKQPVTRMEIEAIRLTGSERAIQTLLERQLIEEVGRKDTPGRPILYGTTEFFLRQFGLKHLDDLPPLAVPSA